MNDAEAKPGADEPNAQPEEQPAADASAAEPAELSPEEILVADFERVKEDAARTKDQLLRTAADFENYRKRARRDVEDAHKKGLERALLEMLPVSDNLERAIQAAGQAKDVNAILEGIRMVLKLTEDALSRLGVERVPSVGLPFDPSQHEAVQQIESDAPAGSVVLELAPGYRLQGKLLRAAMVAVARAKSAAAKNDDAGSPENAAKN